MVDYEGKTIEEIEDLKAVLKKELNEVTAEMQRAEQVLASKLNMRNAENMLKAAGITGVTITPEPGVMKLTGAE